jgi:hypothetical protein
MVWMMPVLASISRTVVATVSVTYTLSPLSTARPEGHGRWAEVAGPPAGRGRRPGSKRSSSENGCIGSRIDLEHDSQVATRDVEIPFAVFRYAPDQTESCLQRIHWLLEWRSSGKRFDDARGGAARIVRVRTGRPPGHRLRVDSLTPHLPRLWVAVFRERNAEGTGGLALYCLADVGCKRNGSSLNSRRRKGRTEHYNEKKNAAKSHARASYRKPPNTGGRASVRSKRNGRQERRHLQSYGHQSPDTVHFAGSVMASVSFSCRFSLTTCFRPDGQVTSMLSIFVASPRPK